MKAILTATKKPNNKESTKHIFVLTGSRKNIYDKIEELSKLLSESMESGIVDYNVAYSDNCYFEEIQCGETMKTFEKKLEEFLESELNDYGLEYEIFEIEDGIIDVDIWNINKENATASTRWRWKEHLEVEMISDLDVWEEVDYYSSKVKYFWMLISPKVFRNE